MGISPVALEVAVTVRVWFSLAAPELIPVSVTVCVPASSATVRLARGSSVGGSLTALTVTRKAREKVLL